jgi:N-methylhydantoinase A
MAFGGAGPLHGNAMGILMNSWPVIIPPSPGVLCAYGDATTRQRVDAQRSFNKLVTNTNDAEVGAIIAELSAQVTAELGAEGVSAADVEIVTELDIRYSGQAFEVPLGAPLGTKIADLAAQFDEEHKRLFTFNLDVPQEIVNIRVVALGKAANVSAERIPQGDGNPKAARVRDHKLYMDGKMQDAAIYDRSKLRAGDVVPGPAVITEMDSTTLVHTGHAATVDPFGNLLINPA